MKYVANVFKKNFNRINIKATIYININIYIICVSL